MGIYRQFPYTNFHEINMDWLLQQVKELTAEWLQYNTTWEEWKTDTDNKFNELREYVTNYFAELDIESEIIKLFDELKDEGFFDEIISQIITKKDTINANMVASGFTNYTENDKAYIDGGCYIGNNHYAVYFSSQSSNIGRFVILDETTWQVISETQMELYHGNSLTFVPDENKVYACKCFSVSNTSVLIPDIAVVDVSDIYNPAIVQNITPPVPDYSVGIYSLAYDPTTQMFHAICARGTTSGEYNRLVAYNKALTEITGSIILADTLPVSSQGCQLVYNKVAYVLYYTPSYRSIYAFDIDNGELLNVYSIPEYINSYRYVGEVEFLAYNYDNFKWFVGSRYTGSGVAHHVGFSIFQVGLYVSIPDIKLRPSSLSDSTGRVQITVNQGAAGVTNTPTQFTSIKDAVNWCVNNNYLANLQIVGELGSCVIRNFKGSIVGTSSAHVQSTGDLQLFGCDIRFTYVDFTGTASNPYFSGVTGALSAFRSNIAMSQCALPNPILLNDGILNISGLTADNRVYNVVRAIVIGADATKPAGGTQVASVYLATN